MSRFAYGPLLKQLREQSMKRHYEIEPEWRRPAAARERLRAALVTTR